MVRTQGAHEEERRIVDDIQRVGWHFVGVEHQPNFAYSVGMYHTFGQPEIVILGWGGTDKMINIIKTFGEQMRQGAGFEDWDEIQALGDCMCMLRNVEQEFFSDYLALAEWFYEGREFPALQCVWPDKSGLYPWEPGFSPEPLDQQPLLTQKIGWPFHEGKNRAVLTTRPVIEHRQPVVWVAHDDKGDWEFLCGTTSRTEDNRTAALSEIVEANASVLELADLPFGWQAIRESPDRPWQRMRM